MNERIKELWTQAEQRQVDDNGGVWVKTIFETRDKFAELIVQECIAMADDFECDVNQRGLVDRMKQHFGVE